MMKFFVPLAMGIAFLNGVCLTTLADHHEHDHTPALQPVDNYYLGVPQAAFGKKFLVSISIIPQSLAATSTGLAGKIVTFERFADAVDLFEDPTGLVVTDDLPARRLVASFPIVKQNDELVTIDFNQGMRRAFTDIWYALGRRFNASAGERTQEIPRSRVFQMEEQDGQLVIRQSAQLRYRQFNADLEARTEIRYFIKPYEPGDYQGKEYNQQDDKYVRFFETAARLEKTTGRPSTRVARFDLNKPLKFYYSSNTPAEYVDAIKGGIEYWNRAFGNKIIEVDQAPEGVTAPDAGHNIVQWVPWDSAGFAYADILVDPVTGESQRGQAYMTSTFAVSGISRARVILRRMRALEKEEKESSKEGEEEKPEEHPHWQHSTVCQMSRYEFAKQYADGLEQVLAEPGVSDEMVLQMSQDYVRGIVAHEVGHVLGLRHNFAGSLDSTMNHERLDKWLSAYLNQEDLSEFENDYTANSMMEYQIFPAMAFTGSKMRTTDTVLPHDKGAIQWGYYDDREIAEKKTLFASDDDAFNYDDVTVFDFGKDPLLTGYADISDTIRRIPSSLIESFISNKAPRDPRDRIPLEQVNLGTFGTSWAIGSGLRDMLRWFNANSRSLTIENQFDYIGELNEQERREAHWKRLNEQVEALGGIDQALFSFLPEIGKLDPKNKPKGVIAAPPLNVSALNKQLAELLESPAYQTFTGLDDQTYEFTEEERELIKKRGALFFERVNDAVVQRVCQVFASARRDIGVAANETLPEEDIISKMEKRLIEFAGKIITKKNDKKVISGKIDKARIEVTDYHYPLETRIAAARMLSDQVGSYKSWSKEGKSSINKRLKADVDGALNIKLFKSFKDSMLSRSLRKWYLDQQEVLKLLPAIRSAPAGPPGK